MAKAKKKGAPNAPAVEGAAPETWWRAWRSEGLAWGLALLILLRPWRDGLTFRTDNFYYLWFIALLFALYLARVLLRGQTIRFGRYLVLAAAFPLVALVLSPATIQVDATYRSLLLWAGHIALFMMVADGIRTPLGFRIVLGAFLIIAFIESFWSLLHYQYVLPALRRILNEEPALIARFFPTDTLTPLLRHRLETNRAFGNFLFPNALAAFLLVGIPYSVCNSVAAIQDLRAALLRAASEGPGDETTRLHYAALIGLLAWFVSFVASVLLYPFFLHHWAGDPNWLGRPVLCATFLGIVPIGAAAIPYGVARVSGALVAGLSVRAVFMPLLALCQVLALYLTFSRGGVLALVVSSAIGALFVALAWKGRLTRFKIAGPGLAALVLVAASLFSSSSAQPFAPDAEGNVAAPEMPAPTDPLNVEGRDLTGADIVNPASFFLRITYWKVSLAIAKDYWLTGVGLGTFPTIYPVYQYLGAGDVQAAHNDYLQFLCETGIFGLGAFLAFWAYLLVNGGRQILGLADKREQMLMTAMLVGVLAFMIHAVVDFPFINPSLAFFEYLMAALFLTRMGLTMPVVANRHAHRIVAGVLLVVTAFAVGASMRVYVMDFIMGGREWLGVGSPRMMSERAQASDFLLKAPRASATPKPGDPAIAIGAAYSLIPSLDLLQSFGVVRVPADAERRSFRAPAPDEAVPPDSFYFITDPEAARAQALKYSELWTQDLRDLDGLYPHNSELALYIVNMDFNMLKASRDPETQRKYMLDALAWAEKAVKRNPMQSVAWQYYGRALTYRANFERTAKALEYYDDMLEAFKRATELYPTGADHWVEYGDKLRAMSEVVRPTNPQRADAMLEESQAALARAEEIRRVRAELGM